MTLVTILEAKFNLLDEAKVPKDLLKADVTSPTDAETLFSTFPHGKARRMRQEVFKILKRVQQFKLLDCKQISPLVGINAVQPHDIGARQYLDWCFQCGEFTEYLLAMTEMLGVAERMAIIKCTDSAE